MGNKTSSKASKVSKASTASAISKDDRDPLDVPIMQNVLLIWLDKNIDENNDDCRNTITQLRRSVHNITTFTDSDACIKFLGRIDQENACLIISGSIGRDIVPRIHAMSQVDTIFIFCGNKQPHEEWTKNWPKIKGIFTEITPICEALKQTAQQCEHNATSISFLIPSAGTGNENLDQLDCSFMYTQILKEILLTIEFESKHFRGFINYCRQQFAAGDKALQHIRLLEHKYRDHTPIYWYTYDCFLYGMLNRALRTMDADIILRMGFFIGDLHRDIKERHSQQYSRYSSSNTFIVYRGQSISKSQFDQMMKTRGGLMAFNNFLSTSKDPKVSMGFGYNALTNPDMVWIHFVMTVDPNQATTPFASIANISYFEREGEVLFSMHSVFRIRDIKQMGDSKRLFQVELTLTNDNDKDLRALTESIRKEIPEGSGWYRMGELLRKIGEFGKAEEVYQVLLDEATDESVKGYLYDRLATIKVHQEEYQESIQLYDKVLEIYRKTLPSHHLNVAALYNNFGAVYHKIHDHPKALSNYEKALRIQQQSHSHNHADLGSSYSNMGAVYYDMGDYPKALSNHKKALEIRIQSLPHTHPHIAMSYYNIGLVHKKMKNYSEAYSLYKKAVDIAKHSLPANHPDRKAYEQNLEYMRDMKQ